MSTAARQQPLAYHAVRISLGVVYFHFGFLKLFPDLSPAELLASQTIVRLTGGLIGHDEALFWLAIMEVAIGIALLFNIGMRFTVSLFLMHMLGTFSPVILLPEMVFKVFPFAPTLEGQYIIKNVVFVAAGWGILVPHVFAVGQNPADQSRRCSQTGSADTQAEKLTHANETQLEPALVASTQQPVL